MGRPIPVADEAIARAALTSMLQAQYDEGGEALTADFLVDTASRVQFRPATRQLVLTFDLAMGGDQSSSAPVE